MSDARHVGIVLAGGESSRMPNKLLLPTFHSKSETERLVVQSAIELCRTVCCMSIVVVTRGADDPTNVVLEKLYSGDKKIRVVHCSGGLGLAVAEAAKGFPSDMQCLVTFGDNVYASPQEPEACHRALSDGIRLAAVREHVPSLAMHASLDWWDDTLKCWQPRQLHGDETYHSHADYPFSGWVVTSASVLKRWPGKDAVHFFRDESFKPFMAGSSLWYDVGTLAGYETYLRRHCR